MNLILEERIDRLTMVINAIDAVKNIPSDDEEDFSTSMIVSEDVPVLIEELHAKDAEMERLRKIEQAAGILVDMSILPENEGTQEWVESRYVNALRKTLGRPGIPLQMMDPK